MKAEPKGKSNGYIWWAFIQLNVKKAKIQIPDVKWGHHVPGLMYW